MTLTKERLQKLIRAIDSESYEEEEIVGWVNSDEILELARIALASLTADPVAWMVRDIDTGEKVIRPDRSYFGGSCQPLYTAPPELVAPAGYRLQPISEYDAMCDAMLQGAEPKRTDAIDSNLVEALRLVQCMLEDYRERNYGDAQGWIRHINTHMSEYSEAHGDDAFSVLHDLLPAAPQQEVK